MKKAILLGFLIGGGFVAFFVFFVVLPNLGFGLPCNFIPPFLTSGGGDYFYNTKDNCFLNAAQESYNIEDCRYGPSELDRGFDRTCMSRMSFRYGHKAGDEGNPLVCDVLPTDLPTHPVTKYRDTCYGVYESYQEN